jgi:aminoglycoside phosphotransferase (APT) family kinase protein
MATERGVAGDLAAPGRDAGRVASALLAHLREAWRAPDLSYARPPTPIAVGVETWVFGLELERAPRELAGPLVLRLFPPDADPERARFEQIVQNGVSSLGYPAPRVPHVCTDAAPLGGPFLIMERIPGRMMLDSLFEGARVLLHAPRLIAEALSRIPRTLAEAQLRLHALDADPLRRSLEAAGTPRHRYGVNGWLEDLCERIDAAGLDGLRPGLAWLRAQRPPEPEKPVICHCDFLPPNLMVEDGRLAGVVDWSHTTLADPALDVANTRLRLALNPFDIPRGLGPVASLVRRRVTRLYLDAYRSGRSVDATSVACYEVLVALSLLVPVGEHRRTGRAEMAEGRGANPWLAPGATKPLLVLCRAVTGLELALPYLGARESAS